MKSLAKQLIDFGEWASVYRMGLARQTEYCHEENAYACR